jgi:hypothetical protein
VRRAWRVLGGGGRGAAEEGARLERAERSQVEEGRVGTVVVIVVGGTSEEEGVCADGDGRRWRGMRAVKKRGLARRVAAGSRGAIVSFGGGKTAWSRSDGGRLLWFCMYKGKCPVSGAWKVS